MRNATVRFEVFCADASPYQLEDPVLIGATSGDVEMRRIERHGDPGLFVAPRFGPPIGEQGKFRQPLPDEHGAVTAAVDRAEVCYVVTAEKNDPADLGYLDAAAALAEDIAATRGGVIVDRTADIGYSLAEFGRLRSDGMRVRDAVSLEERSERAGVTLRTHGMSKYGQSDFLLEAFPFEHVELGRRLLYDNVCDYSAFRAAVVAGQTMGSADYRMFFEEADEQLLRIVDCHPEKKAPLPGIGRLLASLLPIWEQQKAKEERSTGGSRRSKSARTRSLRARAARKASAKGRRKEKRGVKAKAKAAKPAPPARQAKPKPKAKAKPQKRRR